MIKTRAGVTVGTAGPMITIREGCRIIGGEEHPIHPATYYRGVAAGRYPPPVHVSPGVARICKARLLAAIEKIVEENDAPTAA